MPGKKVISKVEPVQGIEGFLQLLKEMEENGEVEKTLSGSVQGPFSSKAVYSCVVKIGFEDQPR